ncbi:unnamed protein product, partial [Staurois parvus]
CRKLVTSVHCALQHALTPLCHFTWPTTSWLSCCCSQLLLSRSVIIPLTVDYGIFCSKEISQIDLLHRWQPITVPRLHSLSSWEIPIFSQMFVEAVCMPRCLILYTCGHVGDWNT